MGSASAKELANALGARRVRSSHVPSLRRRNYYINWGNSEFPFWWDNQHTSNHPEAVRFAKNKLITFELFDAEGIPTVDWTTSQEYAREWCNEGALVFARKILNGREGAGIVKCNREVFVEAPLYTKYLKNKQEYRVHVFNGEVFHIQQKRRVSNGTVVDTQIKSKANGWRFCIRNLSPPESLEGTAIAAVDALGLDFAAVDILFNTYHSRLAILEINSAPGIQNPTTLAKYVEVFQNYQHLLETS